MFDGNIRTPRILSYMAGKLDQRGDRVADLVMRSVSLRPAPAPLDVVQRLVNTRNRLGNYDLLEDLPAAQAWLATVQPQDGEAHADSRPKLDDSDLERLRDLREALRALLLTHASGETPAPEVVERLRSLGAGSHLRVDFGPLGAPMLTSRSELGPVGGQVNEALAALVAVQPDQLRRLKACVNPACGWVFYDASRSRSGTWCVMEVCGARHKMSRYRAARDVARADRPKRAPDL